MHLPGHCSAGCTRALDAPTRTPHAYPTRYSDAALAHVHSPRAGARTYDSHTRTHCSPALDARLSHAHSPLVPNGVLDAALTYVHTPRTGTRALDSHTCTRCAPALDARLTHAHSQHVLDEALAYAHALRTALEGGAHEPPRTLLDGTHSRSD